MSQTLEEEVNIPKHYRTHESGIEAIEITRYLLGDLSNAWKYAMRYEDKNTPKKDIKKLCWYLKDFKENFIDFNNECTANVEVPLAVRDKMIKVIDTEPVIVIRTAFEQIYTIVCAGGLLFPKAYDKVISDLEAYANTLN
jgi:hypothetical protein